MSMRKKTGRLSRDPYYYWKMISMVLACAVLILALLILFGGMEGALIPLVFFLGAVMSAVTGIMELAKNKKITGYLCSVFAGVMAVAMIFNIIWMWFL